MSGSANIASHLVEMARQRPDQVAIIDSRNTTDSITFTSLDATTNRFANQLAQVGVQRGDRVALLIRPSIIGFQFTFAMFRLGAVPVFIDPGIGIRNFGRCLREAEPRVFIGGFKAQAARVMFGWARHSVEISINPARLSSKLPGAASDVSTLANLQLNDHAAVLFTSGSTGPPKGAVYSHGMFQEQVRVLREVFSIAPGEIDLCTFPLFALFAPALGMTSIIPDMDPTRPAKADPAKLRRAIQQFHVTNLFGSPALIKVLANSSPLTRPDGHLLPQRERETGTLNRTICAGAPVSASLISRFCDQVPPGAKFFTPYGATEALPVSVIGSDEILRETGSKTDRGAGICVGRPVGRTEVTIIPISDHPISDWSAITHLPANQIGEIAVRGPVVSASYFNRPEATALAKIPDVATGTFWHRMGDVGYLDESGRLWLCGRKSHRVITPQRTMFTIPCEAIFNCHPQVARSALVGVAGRPVICIEPVNRLGKNERIRLTSELLERGSQHELTKSIRDVLFHRSFPVDIRHNAKINRETLAVWAARQLR